jgi:hypothetical protein
MSYQPNQGYPPQPQQQGYYGDQAQPSSTNPTTAILAALLGIITSAALVVLSVDVLSSGASFSDLTSEGKTILILRFAAAAVLLLGAILVFVRKVAGAIILLLGALGALAAILLYPVLVDVPFGTYLEVVFKFGETQSTFSAITLIAAPLALIFAILPPTLRHLKGSGSAAADVGYHPQQQYPQQNW